MKYLLVAFFSIIIISCSGDDDKKQVQSNWEIRISEECPMPGPGDCYRTTKETSERVSNGIPVGDPCPFVTFKDIDGITRQGYFRSGGTGNCG